MAVQAYRELKAELGSTKLMVTDIFRFPTLGALTNHLGASAKPVPRPVPTATESEPAGGAKMDAMARRRALRMSRRGR